MLYVIVQHYSDDNVGQTIANNFGIAKTEKDAKVLCKKLNKLEGRGVRFCNDYLEIDEIIDDDFEYYDYDKVPEMEVVYE